ncbi:hypothetical protein E2562_035128 [Oryza meyeriana var. granulata]|uniref:Uncharacterized protein n=1 Tax=Oryza meyeriana var. granulata TaxID=110450 RepID=A0A6G1BQG7_9ORYZ|nr:hypothetical protein E2562_035128 [Oryza meyeriana var. granulata]
MVAVDVRATANRQRTPNRGVEVRTLEINDGDDDKHRGNTVGHREWMEETEARPTARRWAASTTRRRRNDNDGWDRIEQ